MSGIIHLLEYSGNIDYKTIDLLLENLRRNSDFHRLDKISRKRVYAIIAECLDNIARHSVTIPPDKQSCKPVISAIIQNGKISVLAGNPIHYRSTGKLDAVLSLINTLEDGDLLSLYDSKINANNQNGNNGAGLGFMLMKLKSGHNLEFRFEEVTPEISFFEVKILINQYYMRKLIIDRTSNSPKVVFDPDKDRYEISGESRPPDVSGFYTGILSWFDDYSCHLQKAGNDYKPVIVDLDFEYFNSSSAKYILDFCKKIAEARSKGNDITVKWHYEDDDTDMLETGREMSKMAKFPFEYVTKVKNDLNGSEKNK